MPLPIETMAIADQSSGSLAFERRVVELDSMLEAIRRQIVADEAAYNAQSPMRKMLVLAQEWMLRHY